MKKLARLLLLAFCAGCSSLPPGTPPEGAIVHNPVVRERVTRAGAINHLITSLSAFTLANTPGAAIRPVGDPETVEAAETVIRECGLISGVKAGNGGLLLKSSGRDGVWRFELVEHGKILWSESFTLIKP